MQDVRLDLAIASVGERHSVGGPTRASVAADGKAVGHSDVLVFGAAEQSAVV